MQNTCKWPRKPLARLWRKIFAPVYQADQTTEASRQFDDPWELLDIGHNRIDNNDAIDPDNAKLITRESNNTLCHGVPVNNKMAQRLPPEIWYDIVKFAAQVSEGQGEDTGTHIYGGAKMNPLWDLASVSKFLRRVVLEHWCCIVYLLERKDLETLEALGKGNGIDVFRFVRRVVCANSYEVYRAPRDSLQVFWLLDELVIDSHRDINFGEPVIQHLSTLDNETGPAGTNETHAQPGLLEHGDHEADNNNEHQHQIIPQPRMSYRRLSIKFPRTLQKLKVYNTHTPDVYIIQKVAAECPLLKSLTLARCTIFTRHQCKFWDHLPRTESDAYFSNQGINAYAAALGKELKQIEHLAEIKLGIYLTDHTAIDTHLREHANSGPTGTGLEIWEHPCKDCSDRHQTATLQSEREATMVLAKAIPTLSRVSWASFCSIGRTGWSTHQIVRDEKGQFQDSVLAGAWSE